MKKKVSMNNENKNPLFIGHHDEYLETINDTGISISNNTSNDVVYSQSSHSNVIYNSSTDQTRDVLDNLILFLQSEINELKEKVERLEKLFIQKPKVIGGKHE